MYIKKHPEDQPTPSSYDKIDGVLECIEIKNTLRRKVYKFNCGNCSKVITRGSRSDLEKRSNLCSNCFSKIKNTKPKDKSEYRKCRICLNKLPISEFSIRETGHRRSECTKCRNLKKFNINRNDWDNMYNKQQGLCATCGCQETYVHEVSKKPKNLSVDHCHSSGKVRGLLCTQCNHALGKVKDKIETLENMIKYLKGTK